MSRLVSAAQKVFRQHPFLTNSAIYGTLYVAAEYSQQYITKRLAVDTVDKKDIDYAVIGRYAIVGTMIYAPSLYIWYKWLDGNFPGTARPIILKKLVLDQLILTPYLLITFYTAMALMEGADDPFLELREKFMPTFMRSQAFWIPGQLLNFTLVPPRYRVIYMGVCGYIWVNILCWIKRQQMQVDEPSKQQVPAESSLPTTKKQ